MDPNSTIMIPEDRHGLYAIDILDPDLVCLFYTELLISALQMSIQFIHESYIILLSR